MTTLFVSPGVFDSAEASIDGDDYHHLVRVARLAVGERIRVADGAGRARSARVEAIDKASARISLDEELPANETRHPVDLLVVGPKKPRAEWLVEKATELGAAAVRFFHSERGPRTYGASAFERFERIARSAAVQSERAVVPEISGMHAWSEVSRLSASSPNRVLLDSSGPALTRSSASSRVALFVGPEGGLTDSEKAELLDLGFVSAGLGPRPLRIETAAVTAVGIVCSLALTPLEGGR